MEEEGPDLIQVGRLQVVLEFAPPDPDGGGGRRGEGSAQYSLEEEHLDPRDALAAPHRPGHPVLKESTGGVAQEDRLHVQTCIPATHDIISQMDEMRFGPLLSRNSSSRVTR